MSERQSSRTTQQLEDALAQSYFGPVLYICKDQEHIHACKTIIQDVLKDDASRIRFTRAHSTTERIWNGIKIRDHAVVVPARPPANCPPLGNICIEKPVTATEVNSARAGGPISENRLISIRMPETHCSCLVNEYELQTRDQIDLFQDIHDRMLNDYFTALENHARRLLCEALGISVRELENDIQRRGIEATANALRTHPNFTKEVEDKLSTELSRIPDWLNEGGRNK